MPRTPAFSPTCRRALAYPAAALVLAVCCTAPTAVSAVLDSAPIRLHPPEPTGTYAVGQVDLHLVDEDRGHPWVDGAQQRDVMATVWYPAEDGAGERAPYASDAVAGILAGELEQVGLPRDAVDFAGTRTPAVIGADVASDAGELPVLLYSPGFRGTRFQATAQLADLASRGYAVVAMDHPYESSAVEFPDGRIVRDTAPELSAKTLRTATGTRVADTRFVLDAVERLAEGGNPDVSGRPLPEGLGRALDPSAVGMFGHSLGGLTTAEAMLVDDRIDAGSDLDGTLAYHAGDEVWADSTVEGVDRPFMLMGGGTSGAEGTPHTSVHSPDWGMFRDASTGPILELYLARAEHMGFIDTQWTIPQIASGLRPEGPAWRRTVAQSVGTIDAEHSVAAQRAYLAAFFDEYLRGQEQPLLDGPSAEHPDVEFVE